jgi:eukaryotic-like serine/threonine-protein kinase
MLGAMTASGSRAPDLQTDSSGWLVGGRYLTIALIGQGGMADVFLARDTVLRRRVALKVFRQRTALVDVWEHSRREVCTVARLNHPNLVTVFDAGEHAESGPYLVTEFVDGPSLAQQISLGPLDPTAVAMIGAHIAAALCYIHGCGIVHCDLKPADILLTRTGSGQPAWTAKLTDFGIAQIRNGHASRDIYSLGLALLEALTGQRAYDSQPVDAAVDRLRHAPEVPAGLGAEWVALLTAMTAGDPAARPDAEAVTATLRDIADDETPEPASLLESLFAADSAEIDAPPQSAAPRSWRRVLIRAAYAAAVPAAAVATVLLVGNPLTGSRHSPPPAAAAAAPAVTRAPARTAPPAPVAPASVHTSSARPVAGGLAVVRLAPEPASKPRAAAAHPSHARPGPVSEVTAGQPEVSQQVKPPRKPKDPPRPGKPNRHGPGGAHGNGRGDGAQG